MNYPSPASSASAPPVIRAVIGPSQSSSLISSSSPPLSYFFPPTQSDHLGNCHILLHLIALPTPYRLMLLLLQTIMCIMVVNRGKATRRSD